MACRTGVAAVGTNGSAKRDLVCFPLWLVKIRGIYRGAILFSSASYGAFVWPFERGLFFSAKTSMGLGWVDTPNLRFKRM